ncbi:hypothetical protein, partial [Staphylococcus hominis]|uniref:hypothetical protein n=1 Tax=Staphylococcus hominis TaxID=1290 RepID=UPI000B17FD33
QQPILDKDGKQIGITVIVKDGNGKEVSRENIYNGKDGKDGQGNTPNITNIYTNIENNIVVVINGNIEITVPCG